MISVGVRVKVLDSYSGGLDNAKGRLAKIVGMDYNGGQPNYVLDIEGERTSSYNYGGGERTYISKYPVIVNGSEIEEVPYEFKDSEGNLVELGDVVAYAVYGGGIIKGTVVDFKDTVYPRWGNPRKELKMKVEYEVKTYRTDGDGRKAYAIRKCTQWLSSQSSTLIIQKNLAQKFFVSKDLLIQDV